MAEPKNTDDTPNQNLIDGPSGDSFASTSDALDEILKSLDDDGGGTPEPKPEDTPAGGEPEGGEPKEGTPVDEPAPEPPTTPEGTPQDLPQDTPQDASQVDEFGQKLDAVQLPPHARPKSAESFATVKTLAKEEVARVRAEAEKLRKEVEELRTKTGQIPEDLQKEIEELRAYRASLDIENAPEAVQARETVKSVEQQVLDTLKENGLNDEGLAHIEKIGGIQHVDWKAIFEKLPEQTVDFLKFKLAEHKSKLKDQAQTVEKLKSKAGEFLKAREEQSKQAVEQTNQKRNEAAESIIQSLPFAKPQEIPADAKPEDRKRIEAQNKEVELFRARVQQALGDTSPEMHATLAVSTALAFRYNAQNKAWAKAYADLEKQHKAVTAELEQIRAARKGKRATSPGPADLPGKKGGQYMIGVSTEEAMAAHLAEINGAQG